MSRIFIGYTIVVGFITYSLNLGKYIHNNNRIPARLHNYVNQRIYRKYIINRRTLDYNNNCLLK
ncbi:hypothetical protein RhiirB3_413843 [Rhizophagus irregularis]|nr:hypothetical protein RhiirB3_413843 [Rhizophagus irregularis]